MKKIFLILSGILLCLPLESLQAKIQSTKRIEQLSNNNVNVWKTIIYPSSRYALPMHRHDHDRVIVALTDGELKISNNKGKIHYFKLKKGKAYYLAKDKANELHNDENMSGHSIKIMVIELKDA